jgi:hypothetical protein
MPDRHYNSDEGEFVDFATLEDWQARDKAKDRQIEALAAERDALRADQRRGPRDYCALIDRLDRHSVRAEKAEAERDAALARAERAEAALRRIEGRTLERAAEVAEDYNDEIWDYATGNRSRVGSDPVAEAIRGLPRRHGGTDE